MCPPHANTTVELAAVMYTLIPVWLATAKEPVNEYAVGFAGIEHVALPQRFPELLTVDPLAGNEPPNTVND